jgi:sphingolipid 4-desaturase/C4-monooxygenase
VISIFARLLRNCGANDHEVNQIDIATQPEAKRIDPLDDPEARRIDIAIRMAVPKPPPEASPGQVDGSRDFFWSYTEEPHKSRRLAIIKAHPDVLKLCGPERATKWVVLAVVSLQVFCAWQLRSTNPLSWQFWAVAYVVGATANQNLFLAIHEISHNLAFKSPLANRLIAVFANLPIGIPYSASFRVYLISLYQPR